MGRVGRFLFLFTALSLLWRVVESREDIEGLTRITAGSYRDDDERSSRKYILRHVRTPMVVPVASPSPKVDNPDSVVSTSNAPPVEQIGNDSQESGQSGISVGGWVGIGFGIVLVLLIAVYFIIGQKKVTEYFVRIIRDRIQRRDNKFSARQHDQETLDSLEVRCSSKSENRHGSRPGSSIGHYETNAGTPMTVHEIPIAPIEIEPDGRMSPKLPIASRQLSGSPVATSFQS